MKDERWGKGSNSASSHDPNPRGEECLAMRRQNLNKHAWATPSQGNLRHMIRKESHVPPDGRLTERGYGNEGKPPVVDYKVRSGKNRVGVLMNILLAMCLGFIVLTLALLVFWVLSQFDPLS